MISRPAIPVSSAGPTKRSGWPTKRRLKAAGLDKKRLPGLEIGRTADRPGSWPCHRRRLKRCPRPESPSRAQRLLDENRAALKVLREAGIVEIHDLSTPDQIDRFVELEAAGELTCRVWLRPDLSSGSELKSAGLTMGLHPQTKQKSYWLRYGALTGSR